MKKVFERKGLASVVLFLMLAMAVLAARPVKAYAQVPPAISTANFNMSYLSSSYNHVGIDLYLPSGWYADTQVLYNGIPIGGAERNTIYASFDVPLAKNRVYEYRIRLYDHTYNSETRSYEDVYGEWSPTKTFCTLVPKVSMASKNGKNVKVKIPKVAGVKSVTFYLSTKSKSGFKKIAKLKPGKSKTFNKFKGKGLVYYKTYYYKVVVKLKDGRTVDHYTTGNFYIRRVWR